MICPYCVEEISAGSLRHSNCEKLPNVDFPKEYVKFHGKKGAPDPILVSVIGFKGHGKTVYMCGLFHYLDHVLTEVWPGFQVRVLDDASLGTLKEHRRKLREGILPPSTKETFPRPGIFRLRNMPHMEDTTVLMFDPPGEAFERGGATTVKLAGFTKRSNCVLFLVDINALMERDHKALDDSVADEMAVLLNTYVLSMQDMGVEEQSQHLLVVSTKADKLRSSFHEFRSFLKEHDKLERQLKALKPEKINNPSEHLEELNDNSQLLEEFTASHLKARQFINVANTYFKSVRYTAVSSLGTSPVEDENGKSRMKVQISPRGVADPLLYILGKSSVPASRWTLWLLIASVLAVATALILILAWFNHSDTEPQPGDEVTLSRTPTPVNIRVIPAATPATAGVRIPSKPDTTITLPAAAMLLKSPDDNGKAIVLMPRGTTLFVSDVKTDSDATSWIKVKLKSQDCQIGPAAWGCCNPVKLTHYSGWVRVTDDSGSTILTRGSNSNRAVLSTHANLRNNAGAKGLNAGVPILILYKGEEVALTGEEEELDDGALWKEVEIDSQSCCVCSPQTGSGRAKVFTVRVAEAEGWIRGSVAGISSQQ